jgi:hypothetical protein
MTDIRFFFDPACPWTWITARWVTEVAPHRNLSITWETFSLRYRNRDNPGYDWIRAELDAQYPALRIIEATRSQFGNEAVASLYTALGTLIHHQHDDNLTRLSEALAMAGLPAQLIDEGANASWDGAIETSTENGRALIGDDAGIPLIVVPDNPSILFGPVLSPTPTGPAAVELWDTFTVLGKFEGLYEIKRTRHKRPIFTPLPATSS